MHDDWLTFDQLEKEIIEARLRAFRYNITKTAETLNISRSTFYRKLEKHRIKIERTATHG